MMLAKKRIRFMMVTALLLFSAGSALAGVVGIEVNISGLETNDLAAFDFNVNYDDDTLFFKSYSLTTELGSFTGPDQNYPDAEDWSFGDDGFGTVGIAVVSYLDDFSTQSDAFTMATLYFEGSEDNLSAMHGITVSDIILSDALGDSIIATVDTKVVPIPGALWLLGSAIFGLAGLRKRLS